MLQEIGIVYLVVGLIIGIYYQIKFFDKNEYIWNREKGVDIIAVLYDVPSMLVFTLLVSVGWGAWFIIPILDHFGLIPNCRQERM